MRKILIIGNALFPYLVILCTFLLAKIGLWPFAVLAVIFGALLVLNGIDLWRKLRQPDAPPDTLAALIVKLIQIPAFVAIFFIACMTVAFIALPILLFLLDVGAILLTGLFSAGNAVQLYRKGLVTQGMAIALGVFSFIFCADVIAAAVAWWLGRQKKT